MWSRLPVAVADDTFSFSYFLLVAKFLSVLAILILLAISPHHPTPSRLPSYFNKPLHSRIRYFLRPSRSDGEGSYIELPFR